MSVLKDSELRGYVQVWRESKFFFEQGNLRCVPIVPAAEK